MTDQTLILTVDADFFPVFDTIPTPKAYWRVANIILGCSELQKANYSSERFALANIPKLQISMGQEIDLKRKNKSYRQQ